MSAEFRTPDEVFATSNGGAESLCQALAHLARVYAGTPAQKALASWLEEQWKVAGVMGGFDVRVGSHAAPELEPAEARRFLCFLLREFAREVAGRAPDPALADIPWDRELRVRWLQDLCDFHDGVARTLPPAEAPLPMAPEGMSPEESQVFALHRALHQVELAVRWKIRAPGSGELSDLLARVASMAGRLERDGALGAGVRRRLAGTAGLLERRNRPDAARDLRALAGQAPPAGPGAARLA